MSPITGYHAHVYFDTASREKARELCEAASRAFHLSVGRMQDRPVGPHPRESCQLAFATEQFAELIPWLIVNRNGLTIFAHAITVSGLLRPRRSGVDGSSSHAAAFVFLA